MKPACSPELLAQFVGNWTIARSFFRKDTGEPYGATGQWTRGSLVYSSDGLVAAQLCSDRLFGEDRPRFPNAEWAKGAPEDWLKTLGSYVAYFGTFSIDEARHTICHRVHAALQPEWIGSEQVRTFEFHDGRLLLATSVMVIGPGTMGSAVLEWERYKP